MLDEKGNDVTVYQISGRTSTFSEWASESSIPMAELQRVLRGVLWYFGHPYGLHPGGFHAALMTAFAEADRANFDKLRNAYGLWSRAWECGARTKTGINEMARLLDGGIDHVDS